MKGINFDNNELMVMVFTRGETRVDKTIRHCAIIRHKHVPMMLKLDWFIPKIHYFAGKPPKYISMQIEARNEVAGVEREYFQVSQGG